MGAGSVCFCLPTLKISLTSHSHLVKLNSVLMEVLKTMKKVIHRIILSHKNEVQLYLRTAPQAMSKTLISTASDALSESTNQNTVLPHALIVHTNPIIQNLLNLSKLIFLALMNVFQGTKDTRSIPNLCLSVFLVPIKYTDK